MRRVLSAAVRQCPFYPLSRRQHRFESGRGRQKHQ